MNEIATRPTPEPPTDNAAAAFDAMRRQLALLAAAVEGFAARQDVIAARDYAPDLAQIIELQDWSVKAIKTLAGRPGIALTPEVIAEQIEAAAVTVRCADHEALAEATRRQIEATRHLEAMIGQARAKQQQSDALIWAWVSGAITVLVVIALRHLRGMSGI
jgi:hypothetical protein